MAESDLHRQLKRAACRWLWRGGYAAIAEEVPVPGVGIIDVVGAGRWKRVGTARHFPLNGALFAESSDRQSDVCSRRVLALSGVIFPLTAEAPWTSPIPIRGYDVE